MSVTAVTGSMLKLKKAKFAQMTSISADGIHFPHKPQEYKEEVLRQARELHFGRHVPMLSEWLAPLAARYRTAMPDRPHLQTSIRLAHTAQQGTRVDPKAPDTPGEPPKFQEMYAEIKRPGLEAAAFGELTPAVLLALTGSAIWVLTNLIHASYAGARARILNGVLHLCLLQKKKPQWLVRMSRPVMLEEPVKREESTAFFHRLQAAGSAAGLDPPSSFAYRGVVL